MPTFIPPQLLKSVSRPPSGPDWLHEIKYDGYRIQVRVETGRTRIHTRKGFDWTHKFRRLEAEGGELPDCILDGELCALDDDGKPNFSRLVAAIRSGQTDDLVYFAFDLLFEGLNNDLRPFALGTRKTRLRAVLDAGGEHIADTFRYVEEQPGPGPQLLRAACELQLEGIVSKRRGESYRSGRSPLWQKAKCRPEESVVIGGYRPAPDFALACGIYDEEGRLTYVGRVKNGFAGRAAVGLVSALKPLVSDANPFQGGPVVPKDTIFVRPELVGSVAMEEITDAGKMRHAVFKGLQSDRTAQDLLAQATEA